MLANWQIIVVSEKLENLKTNALKDIPIVTKHGNVLRVEQLAKIEVINAPEQIRRLGGRPGNVNQASSNRGVIA